MGCIVQKKTDGFELDSQPKPGAEATQIAPEQKVEKESYFAWRYYIATLSFISYFLINCQRMAMSVAVVNMSNFTYHSIEKHNSSKTFCPVAHINATQDSVQSQVGGDFDWSPQIQGFVLGAAFLGFAVSPMLAGRFSDKYGAKGVVFWGNTIAAVGLLFCPTFSWWHVYSLIALQLVRGIAQGFVMSAAHTIMAKWTPRKERAFFSSFILAGFHSGSLVGGMLAGYLCQNPYLGWRSVYYIIGTVGILYSILHILTFYETPGDHPKISQSELKYITEDQAVSKKQKKLPAPWLKMFTSVSTYALIFGVFSYIWKVFYFISVHMAYLSNILHFSILKSGFIGSMPFVLQIAACLFVSAFSDWLSRRKYISVDKIRRGCCFIGCLVFSLSMLGLYLSKCSEWMNILFYCTALLSIGCATPGARIAGVDMAPNFAGTLMGIMTTIATTSGFIIPVVVGFMTKDQTLEGWQNVFLVNIVVVMVCGTIFAVFGSANVQPWNFPSEEATKDACSTKGSSEPDNSTKEDQR